MNTTLSEAVTTTFASDEPFFTTEQVTSVAEEIIGDVPVMFLSTINKQTERSRHEPLVHKRRIKIADQRLKRTFNNLRLFSKEKTHDPHPMCECLPGAIEVDI